MIELIGLPREIITIVIDQVYADDLESLMVTCKRIHSLCASRIEQHLALKRQYVGIVFCNSMPRPYAPHRKDFTHFPNAGTLLARIFERPVIAEYVKTVVYEAQGFNFEVPATMPDWKDRIPALIKTLRLSPSTTRSIEEEQMYWQQQLKGQSEHVMMTVLLAMLPNLETLHLEGQHYWDCSYDQMRWWGDSLKDSLGLAVSYSVQGYRDGRRSNLPFRKLKNILWDPDEPINDLDCQDLMLFVQFMGLPSLEYMRGSPTGFFTPGDWGIEPRPSNLRYVDFYGGILTNKDIDRFLGHLHDLRKFRYRFNRPRDIDSPCTDAFKIVETLKRTAVTTLEELTLLPFTEISSLQPSIFTGFKNLRILEVGLESLVKVPASCRGLSLVERDEREERTQSTQKLAELIPRSIEKLEIHAYWPTSMIELQALFEDLDSQDDMLPNLTAITLCCYDTISEGVRASIENAGIGFKEKVFDLGSLWESRQAYWMLEQGTEI